MLCFCVFLGFLLLFSFPAADCKKELAAERIEAVSALLSPHKNPEEKHEASDYLEKIMNKIENYKNKIKEKPEAFRKSDDANVRDETDDYVNYQIPSNELFVNVFDYDGLLNGTSWFVFDEFDLEPAPVPSKFEILKRFFSGAWFK